jgi:hypothetical protein
MRRISTIRSLSSDILIHVCDRKVRISFQPLSNAVIFTCSNSPIRVARLIMLLTEDLNCDDSVSICSLHLGLITMVITHV